MILEAGLGDSSAIWKAVQFGVAEITRVCAYDRNLLLRAAAISGPYVLVGHSLGGAYIRLYASRFPQDIVGMVLVDASHEDQFARFASAGYAVVLPAGQNSERTDMAASLDEVGQAPWRADIPLVVLSHGRRFVDSLAYFKNQVFSRDTSGYRVIKRGSERRAGRRICR